MGLPHGDAHAHRPDRQPAGVALRVAPAGGGPWVSQRWDGPTSDPRGFQERAEAWRSAGKTPPRPRSRVAEATRACEAHAASLAPLGLLPRMPATRKGGSQVLSPALQGAPWPPVAPPPRSQPLAWGP